MNNIDIFEENFLLDLVQMIAKASCQTEQKIFLIYDFFQVFICLAKTDRTVPINSHKAPKGSTAMSN
jgi:hypothetical protein